MFWKIFGTPIQRTVQSTFRHDCHLDKNCEKGLDQAGLDIYIIYSVSWTVLILGHSVFL